MRIDVIFDSVCPWCYIGKRRLEKALAQTMKDHEIQEKLVANGLEPSYATPEQVSAMIDKDLPRMRAIAQKAGIQAN